MASFLTLLVVVLHRHLAIFKLGFRSVVLKAVDLLVTSRVKGPLFEAADYHIF